MKCIRKNHSSFIQSQSVPEFVQTNKSAGFTLVEMLVSIALFTVVLTISVSTLLVLIDSNGRAQSMQLVMTNLTFSLDSMTREIRNGINWYCGTYAGSGEPSIPSNTSMRDCDSGSAGNYISIIESGRSLTSGLNSPRVTYWFDDSDGELNIKRKLGDATDVNEDWVSLTGPEIVVDEMRIVTSGTDRYGGPGGNTTQPFTTIYITGTAGRNDGGLVSPQVQEFDIQTTVTHRTLDV